MNVYSDVISSRHLNANKYLFASNKLLLLTNGWFLLNAENEGDEPRYLFVQE